MAESLNPRRPFYDKEGRVRDQRIAQAMADTEDIARDPSARGVRMLGAGEAGRRTPEGLAEAQGEDFYRKNGIEIPQSDVPRNVLEAFTQEAARSLTPSDDLYAEFRRIDSEDGKTTYVMLFRFERIQTGWLCSRVDCSTDGVVSPVMLVHFNT